MGSSEHPNQKLNAFYYLCNPDTQFVLKQSPVEENSLIAPEAKPTNLVVMSVGKKKPWVTSWMSNPSKGPITFDRTLKAIDWLYFPRSINESKLPEKRELKKMNIPQPPPHNIIIPS